MLVYANSFFLNPDGGARAVINQIATWLAQTRRSYVDPERLSKGIRELRFTDGATLSSIATVDEDDQPFFPYQFCARLMHPQPEVPGRRWVAEVGILQGSESDALQCSVLVKTDEVSARVTAPIQVTRPLIVQQLIQHCTPLGNTPGLSIVRLDEANAAAFAYEIEHQSRRHPIVQISCDREGGYPVTPERLRSVLTGLAQVIEISTEADTYKIQRILGRRYSAYGGAINIIFPARKTDEGSFCKTVMLRPDQIWEIKESGATIESDVLATITHQTNLPHSWRHISTATVGQAVLRARLRKAAVAASDSEEVTAYETLLQEAGDRLQTKDAEVAEIRLELEDREANLDCLRAEIDALKHALSGRQSRSDAEEDAVAVAIAPLRDAVISVLGGQPPLEQALRLIQALFPNRVIVLDSAFDSAKDSDRGGFRYGSKAFELLKKLSEEYWVSLAGGKGDQQARIIFGNNAFASKESETLTSEGRIRRTFNYLGRDILMETHIRHGYKDSFAETLRIHFEWLADEKKLVIGHCGKHLNF